jgi:shikimate kinase/3-dehydroquinate synthase
MIDNLYLTGFMGAGKTTVGRALADLLRRDFVDVDQRLVMRLGRPITEAFADRGEAAFRRAETAELARLARRHGLVVATGGGLPAAAENRRLMRDSGRIVHLAADLATCRRRLGPTETARRPLWQDEAGLARLFEARQAVYADCDLALGVNGQRPAEVAGLVAAALWPERRAEMGPAGAIHPLINTWDAPRALAEFFSGRRVVILTDQRVADLHFKRYQGVLGDARVIVVRPGERSKSLPTAKRVYRAMLDGRVERGDLLVALGGGVVTDLGAFVAATYKRGLDFVLVATTLVGGVDAAVGGKAALNLGTDKNQVGCFTLPAAVIQDIPALSTLPRRAVKAGLVEAYKTALLSGEDLTAQLESDLTRLLAGDLPGLAETAWASAKVKAEVVRDDFREEDRRRVLNLGHTLGHALEGVSRFRLSHGQAVALGLMVAVELSRGRGLLDDETADRILKTLSRLAPRRTAWPSAEQAWELMALDKKNRGGRVCFILLAGVGRPLIVDDVTVLELAAAMSRAGGR